MVAMLTMSIAVGVYSGYKHGRREVQVDHASEGSGSGGRKPTVHVQVPRQLTSSSAPSHPSPTPPSPPPPPSPSPPDPRWAWPKFLHQSYKNYDMSDNFKKWSSEVKSVNPDYTYVFWTDEVGRTETQGLGFKTRRSRRRRRTEGDDTILGPG